MYFDKIDVIQSFNEASVINNKKLSKDEAKKKVMSLPAGKRKSYVKQQISWLDQAIKDGREKMADELDPERKRDLGQRIAMWYWNNTIWHFIFKIPFFLDNVINGSPKK